MAEQLTFELASPSPPSFANFVGGPNVEAVDTLARLARGGVAETGIVLWGASGAGKSHLLQAVVAAAREHGRAADYVACANDAPATPSVVGALLAVDCIDEAESAAQARLFSLYNALAGAGGQLVAAASAPPARMTLRDDLRTRLGWGLVYEVVPLSDAEKPAALAAFAAERGFRLPDDVIGYLLAHGRRDMDSLVRTLVALDRHSLALRRPVTLPLVKAWLRHDFTLPPRA